MRIRSRRQAFTHRPFAGTGTSLYVSAGDTVQYRNLRLLARGKRHRGQSARRGTWIKGSSGVHDITAASVLKTCRAASAADPTSSFAYALPAALLPPVGQTRLITFDVRTYAADVENESENFRTVSVLIDSNGNDAGQILGTARLLNIEVRAAGIVRLRFIYLPSTDGVQPTQFKAMRTAGPTTPADVTVSWSSGRRILEIDTPPLSDAAPYTYTIRALNQAGTVMKDVLTGIAVQADATGPDAPGAITTEVL